MEIIIKIYFFNIFEIKKKEKFRILIIYSNLYYIIINFLNFIYKIKNNIIIYLKYIKI